MENRDKMICRNLKYKIFSMVVLVACMMFLSGCIFAPTKKEVENYVANQTDEDCRIINSSGNPFYKTYMFRSRERDLEFDVDADTKNGQKNFTMHYGAGVYAYYYPRLKEEFENSECQTEDVFVFHINGPADLKAVSETLANCNDILSDQWNYTPGADLTDSDFLGINIFFDIPNGNGGRTRSAYKYVLNGFDDEEGIYNLLEENMGLCE